MLKLGSEISNYFSKNQVLSDRLADLKLKLDNQRSTNQQA